MSQIVVFFFYDKDELVGQLIGRELGHGQNVKDVDLIGGYKLTEIFLHTAECLLRK